MPEPEGGSSTEVAIRWTLANRLDERLGPGYIDLEEEGYFEFDQKGSGQFHFGYVHGNTGRRLTTRDGEPAVEWAWDGDDEMDPAQAAAGPWSRATNGTG